MDLKTAGLYSLLGLCIVFFALILLMLITKLMVKLVPATESKPNKTETKAEINKKEEFAPGSAGDFKLNGVNPRDAAMCMAIIADQLKKPLNELKFISIKEVEK